LYIGNKKKIIDKWSDGKMGKLVSVFKSLYRTKNDDWELELGNIT
jgi:hypothetical protein